MTDHEYQELLETLDEIVSLTGALTADLTDKKTISDIMLAMEKIIPPLNERVAPKVTRLGVALASLYEKFLMETVANGEPGLEQTVAGIAVIRRALTKEGSPTELDSSADTAVSVISSEYGIETPPAEPSTDIATDTVDPVVAMDSSSDETEELANDEEEDDFFVGMTYEPKEPHPEFEKADEPAQNESILKISAIASNITMLDPEMTDKKLVSDLVIGFDNLVKDFTEKKLPHSLILLCKGLSGVFEKSLMAGLDDGELAVKLTGDGVRILDAFFEDIEDKEAILGRADDLTGFFVADLGIEIEDEQQKREAPQEAEPEDEGSHPKIVSIPIASDDDLLLYSEFVSETSDMTVAMEEGLLELEENPEDENVINTIFRAFHSLKGAAGFLGLNTVNVLCHECENLLDKLRKKTLDLNQEMIDVFLKSVDVIKAINEELDESCTQAKSQTPNTQIETTRFKISDLLSTISNLVEGKRDDDSEGEEADETEMLGDILLKKRLISEGQLKQALENQKPVGKILVEMGVLEEKVVDDALREQSQKRTKKKAVAALKVDTEKLDSLLELVGELVISQSIVAQDSVLGDDLNKGLQKNLSSMGKITKNIQDHVMNLRMIPIKQTFQKMSRLVRDLSKKMEKPVTLHLSGEETEIDKTLVEELSDPLVHLMRNALDHGLEPQADRIDAGKSPTGNVWLSAYHKGGNVYIEVTDDGRGLNRDRIHEKAVEKGLIDPDHDLSEHEIYNLILEPGFSTAQVVTDVSGRGVGMDVVRSNIDRLGGRIEINSTPGKGSTMAVKLPLTMAIVDGMIVRIGDERFIIPTISIRESIRPKKDEISTVRNQGELINIRGRLLPLVRLVEKLNVEDAECLNPWEGLVIIVESDDKEYGLMVDDLLGQQQVVIKSLGKRFKGLAGISGGTILGDGRVGLILDVAGVVEMN